MTATLAYAAAFAIVGLLVYFKAKDSKAQEAGRLMYFAGVFWLVYQLASHTLHLGT
jgi:Na+/phosphate symporter